MQLRDSYKEHYLLESTRRNELTSALAVPIAILSAVLGVLAVVAKDLHVPLDGGGLVQLVFVVLGALASALSTYFLFRSLYGLAYAYVPSPTELAEYAKGLSLYYVGSGLREPAATAKAEAETLAYLYGEYAKNTDRNANNNDIKSGHLHNANSALIAAVVLTALAGVAYVVSSVVSPATPNKVEVINMPSFATSSPSPLAAASSPPAPPPPPPAVKPEPPPSRVVREHRVPPPPPPPPPSRK
jgi:drug/metabolite transporter (DMT)-like permease